MKNLLILLIVLSAPSFADGAAKSNEPTREALAATLDVDLDTNPLVEKNVKAAEFGSLVVSQAFTYPKAVRRKNGVTVVDVIIIDKLCHVKIDETSEKLKASTIECDEGKYFPLPAKSN